VTVTWTDEMTSTCANVDCPNAPHEGMFRLISADIVVGGHRGFRLWLCAPCAHTLIEATK
jgi:hypothetical protein